MANFAKLIFVSALAASPPAHAAELGSSPAGYELHPALEMKLFAAEPDIVDPVGMTFDEDGRTARAGKVNEDVLRFYLAHAFFGALPPKSLDRAAFFSDLVDWMSVEDGAATLTAFTAGAIARAREHMAEEPALWIISGGGRRNGTLMAMLAARVQNAVVPAEAVGLSGDAIEAEAWGYLAVRSLRGLPLTFPGTTGVSAPTTGGILTRAPRLVM